jgi:hypothetical protein
LLTPYLLFYAPLFSPPNLHWSLSPAFLQRREELPQSAVVVLSTQTRITGVEHTPKIQEIKLSSPTLS